MSFLFHKRTRKVVNIVWGIAAIIVSLGMIFAYAPGLLNWLSSL